MTLTSFHFIIVKIILREASVGCDDADYSIVLPADENA